LRADV
jgi:hypothetical protein